MIVKPYFADFAGIEFGKKDDPVLRPGVKESMAKVNQLALLDQSLDDLIIK